MHHSLALCGPKSETPNLEAQALNPKRKTLKLKPKAPNPKALNPEAHTPGPNSRKLHGGDFANPATLLQGPQQPERGFGISSEGFGLRGLGFWGVII